MRGWGVAWCTGRGFSWGPGGSVTALGPGDGVGGDGDAESQTREHTPSRIPPERMNGVEGRPVKTGLTGDTVDMGEHPPDTLGQSVVSVTVLDSLEPRARALGQRVG